MPIENKTRLFSILCSFQFVTTGMVAYLARSGHAFTLGLSLGAAVVVANLTLVVGIVLRPLLTEPAKNLRTTLVPPVLGTVMPMAASMLGAAITTSDPRWYVAAILLGALVVNGGIRPRVSPIPKRHFLFHVVLSYVAHLTIIISASAR